MKQLPNLRWWIAGLLAAACALAYIDRQTLPVVINEIHKTIPINDQQYARLQFTFLFAYGIMYAGGGKLIDVLGTRWGYAVIIAWWSAANLMQGTISSVLGLGAALFLLGLGEGGAFPAAAKAVSEWFPEKERSLAFGIFNAGSGLGATIAPPFIAAIVLRLNWRWVFFITATMGFVWAFAWLRFYRLPLQHPWLTTTERAYLDNTLSRHTRTPNSTRVPWLNLFRFRQVWGLVAARFLGDAAWFFFIFWLPKYLGDVRHLNIRSIGYYAWVPYGCASVGSVLGGGLSSYLLSRHISLDSSRKLCLGFSAACMPLSLLIASSPLSIAIAFFSLAMLGHQSWSTILQTLAADMFPPAVVGSVVGILGTAGAFGGMIFNLVVGSLLMTYHSYGIIFTIVGLLHPVSFFIILTIVRKIEPLVGPVISEPATQ